MAYTTFVRRNGFWLRIGSYYIHSVSCCPRKLLLFYFYHDKMIFSRNNMVCCAFSDDRWHGQWGFIRLTDFPEICVFLTECGYVCRLYDLRAKVRACVRISAARRLPQTGIEEIKRAFCILLSLCELNTFYDHTFFKLKIKFHI